MQRDGESLGAGLLNRVARWAPVEVEPAIVFDAGHHLALDVYRPRAAKPRAPTIAFFYGGGWDSGFRAMYRFVGAALASRGFTVVIPDYRVYPAVRFPDFLADAALAVRWTVDHIAAHGGDSSRLLVAGHSAGAHIAAMLAFDRQWLGAVGLAADRTFRGLVGLAGPYDFLPLHSPLLKTIFGPEPALWTTQPINFVDRPVLPAFLAAGARDPTVDPGNSVRLTAAIRTHGGRAELKLYPRANHVLLVGAFSPLLRPFLPVLADVTAFVEAVAGAAAPVGSMPPVPA